MQSWYLLQGMVNWEFLKSDYSSFYLLSLEGGANKKEALFIKNRKIPCCPGSMVESFFNWLFKAILPERAVTLVTAALCLAKTVKISFRELYCMNKLILFHASCFYANILCHFFDFCQCHTLLLLSLTYSYLHL